MSYVDVYTVVDLVPDQVRDEYVDIFMVVDGFDPDQPRAPAGTPEGGRWTSGGSSGFVDPYDQVGMRGNYTGPEWLRGGTKVRGGPPTVAALNRTGLSPEELYHRMTGGLGGDLQAMTRAEDPDVVTFMGGVPNSHSFFRDVNLREGYADHSSFEVEDVMQGRDVAKSVLAGQIDAYRKMGLREVRTTANLDVGGYAWAKYGFAPGEGDWNMLRREIYGKIDDYSPPAPEYDAYSKILDSRDPKSIWALSDSPLGKNLLIGRYWNGKLDLRDRDSMARFDAYVSRRRRVGDAWSEEDHPRVPAGSSEGGQFTSSGGEAARQDDLQRKRRAELERDLEAAARGDGDVDPYEVNAPYLEHFEDEAERARERAATLTERADRMSDDPLNSRARAELEEAIDEATARADRYERMAENIRDNPLVRADWSNAGVHPSDDQALGLLNGLGVPPEDFREHMLGGHDGDLLVHGSLFGTLTVESQSDDFRFQRVLDPRTGSVNNAYFKVDSSLQGSSVGKDVLLGQAALYEQTGLFDRMTVYANIDVGGYAWARYGYVPRQESWDSFRQYADYTRITDPADRQAVRQILSSSDPKSMWAVADSRYGRDLLLNKSWSGELNFRDPDAMRRFRVYLGGNR